MGEETPALGLIGQGGRDPGGDRRIAGLLLRSCRRREALAGPTSMSGRGMRRTTIQGEALLLRRLVHRPIRAGCRRQSRGLPTRPKGRRPAGPAPVPAWREAPSGLRRAGSAQVLHQRAALARGVRLAGCGTGPLGDGIENTTLDNVPQVFCGSYTARRYVFLRQEKNVAWLTPAFRQMSPTGAPSSACLRMNACLAPP